MHAMARTQDVFDARVDVFPTKRPDGSVVLNFGSDERLSVFMSWSELTRLVIYLGDIVDRRTQLQADAEDAGELVAGEKLSSLTLA